MQKITQLEKDRRAGLLPPDTISYEQIHCALFERLSCVLDIEQLEPDPDGLYVIDRHNRLGFELTDREILVFHPAENGEHKHFFGMNYQTVKEWTADAASYIAHFVQKTVRYEYHYYEKALTKTVIRSIDGDCETVVDSLLNTCNPLRVKSSTAIVAKQITYAQQ